MADDFKELVAGLEKKTVDTSAFAADSYAMDLAESRLACVAVPFLVPSAAGVVAGLDAIHLTDDPGPVLSVVREGRDLQEARPYGDICGGLYVSACPDFWAGRSRRKWDFMNALPPESHERMRQSLETEIEEQRRTGYITASERENALGILKQWRDTGYWQVATILAGQPYNINLQDLARELGVAEPTRPIHVPVRFFGRYLEVMERAVWKAAAEIARRTFGISDQMMTQQDLCAALRRHGWDGAFTRAGMSTNPELVVWSTDKILMFGDWARPTGAELAGRRFERKRVW